MRRLTPSKFPALAGALGLLLLSMPAQQTKAQVRETLDAAADVIAATPAYDLAIGLKPDAHKMEVAGTLRLPPADTVRTSITLELSALMSDFHVEVLEPAEIAGPVSATAAETADRRDGPRLWIVQPPKPLAAHKPILLRLSYQGGDSIAFVFYIGPEGSFAGGSNSPWYPQLEGTSGKGTGHLRFSVPEGYTVLATGARQSTAVDEQQGHFVFADTVPTVFAFAAARYTVLQRDGVVPMRLYLLHPRPNAEEYLDAAAGAISTLTQEFGPYPYAAFAIAEVPPEQAHQAGFSGASMNGFMLAETASLDAPFNLGFYGHEISHLWWGNLVTHSGSRGDYLLDEAMSQYGSLRAVETIEGAVAAEQYRRRGYRSSPSQCGYGYLLASENGADHALGDLPSEFWSHELADSKGFLVLDLLSRTIGRERFRGVLRDFTRKYAFRSVGWDEFRAAVQGAANEDLGWFFSQWFERTGAPDWQVAWKQEAAVVRGEITQTAPFYRQDLEIELAGANGEQAMHTVAVTDARTEWSWPVDFRVGSVELDPHFYVLHWLPELRAAARARGPALHAQRLSDAGKPDEAETELRQALASLPQPDEYGALYWAEYSLGCVFMSRKDWTQAQQHFDAALIAPTRDPDTLPLLFYRYAQAAKNVHDDAKLRWAVNAAVSADAANGGRTGAQYWAPLLLAAQ
jgi:tetratricopeptide (TPR) repeat protein